MRKVIVRIEGLVVPGNRFGDGTLIKGFVDMGRPGHVDPPGGSGFKRAVGGSKARFRSSIAARVGGGYPFRFKISGVGHAVPVFVEFTKDHQHVRWVLWRGVLPVGEPRENNGLTSGLLKAAM